MAQRATPESPDDEHWIMQHLPYRISMFKESSWLAGPLVELGVNLIQFVKITMINPKEK